MSMYGRAYTQEFAAAARDSVVEQERYDDGDGSLQPGLEVGDSRRG
jgi:hypothetical protein